MEEDDKSTEEFMRKYATPGKEEEGVSPGRDALAKLLARIKKPQGETLYGPVETVGIRG